MFVTIVGCIIGKVRDRKIVHFDAPSMRPASRPPAPGTSLGTSRSPAASTSMEKPAVDQILARQMIVIGNALRKSIWVPVTKLRVPPDVLKAYHSNAAVIGGSIQATTTIAPTATRSQAMA